MKNNFTFIHCWKNLVGIALAMFFNFFATPFLLANHINKPTIFKTIETKQPTCVDASCESANSSFAVLLPPSNDDCSGAIELIPSETGCNPISGTTVGATQSLPASLCIGGNPDDDIWYKFVATKSTHTIQLTTDFPFIEEVREGSSCNGVVLNCLGGTYSPGTIWGHTIITTVGTTYFIRIYSAGTETGNIGICVTAPPSCIENPIYPTDGQSNICPSATTTLTWPTTPNAIKYYVYFGNTASPPFAAITSNTSLVVNTPTNGTYFWRVDPFGLGGSDYGCAVWNFTLSDGSFTLPPNGSSTVACPSTIVQPVPPTVVSNCGSPVTMTGPSITNNPNPITCEGTRTYTWNYNNGFGQTQNWSHIVTVDRVPFQAGGLSMNLTVACPAQAVLPAVLPVVTSNCGEILAPSSIVMSSTPNPVTCEGTVKYTVTYTDCAANTSSYSINYTIERQPFTVPAIGSATVTCPAAANIVPVPPVVQSNCGETLTPTGSTVTSTAPCEVTKTYTWIYSDCEGNTLPWSFTYSIVRNPFTVPVNGVSTVACPALIVQPVPPVILSTCGEAIIPTGPAIANVPNPITCEGTRTFTWTYTDCSGNVKTWSHVTTVERQPFSVPANGGATVACPDQTDIQPTPPIVTSNCGEVLTPVISSTPKPGCEGNRNWNFTYTDCEGNTATWTFIYTVEYLDFVVPASEIEGVNCPINIVQPIPPSVTDNCGKQLMPTGPVIANSNNASGCLDSRKYEWTYKDCEGNTHVWSKTFNIEYNGDFFVYPDGETEVECLAYAQSPVLPPTIYGYCGEELLVFGPTVTESIDPSGCSGTRKFTFIYVDCGGHNHSWSFTYFANDKEPPVGECVGGTANNVDVTNLACMDDVPCPEDFDFKSKIDEMIAAGNIHDLCNGNDIIVELDSWSSLWQCSDADGDGIYTFGRTFYFRIADQCGNEMPSLCSVTYSGKCLPLQTFTQNEWGIEGDEPHISTPADTTNLQTITTLLSQGPLTIGGSHRSLTLTNAQCVLNLLPGVGNPTVLANCIQTNCVGCNPAGTIGMKNSLAANTIALMLNMRFNVQYNNLPMANIRNQALGCRDIDPNIKICSENGVCQLRLFEMGGTEHVFPNTIGGLLDLANLFLDGNLTLSLGNKLVYASAINNSVSSINADWHGIGATTNACDPNAGAKAQEDNSDKVILPTAKPAIDNDQPFSLTPNPASREVKLKLSDLGNEREVSVEIYNSLGQLVLHHKYGQVSYLDERLDLTNIGDDGLYIVMVKAGEKLFCQKLIVSKS